MKQSRISDSQDHVSEDAVAAGQQLLPPGAILMVVRGMILAHTFPVALTDAPVTINQDIKALRTRPDIDPAFLLYVLQAKSRTVLQLVEVANHGTKRLPTERLQQMGVPLPSLPEQRRIASILSAVDEAIEATEAVANEVDRVRRLVADHLILRGAGSTKVTDRARQGWLPRDWVERPLSDVATVQTGIAKGKPGPGASVEVPYLRVANVQDGYVDLDEVKAIRVEPQALERYSLRAGDVLFTEGGDFDKLGRGCVWRGQIVPCLHQNHVFAVRTSDALLPDFLAAYAASSRGRAYFLDCAKRTTNLASINSTQLKAFPVPVPPLDQQQAIVAALSALAERADRERAILAQKRSLKAALAEALLAGHVRVPDLKAIAAMQPPAA